MASGKNSLRKAKKRRQEASTSGTTWVSGRTNKIIQVDEGRNKKRLLKEKVGQDISKVRARQKSRSDLKKTAEVAGSNVKRTLLKIKNRVTNAPKRWKKRLTGK